MSRFSLAGRTLSAGAITKPRVAGLADFGGSAIIDTDRLDTTIKADPSQFEAFRTLQVDFTHHHNGR